MWATRSSTSTRSSRPGRAARCGSSAASSASRRSGSTGSSSRRTPIGREHDETRLRPGGGQRHRRAARAPYRIDGEDVPVRAGTFLRFDPETTRVPIAGPDGHDDDRDRRAARELRAARAVLSVVVRLLIWNVARVEDDDRRAPRVAPRARAAEPLDLERGGRALRRHRRSATSSRRRSAGRRISSAASPTSTRSSTHVAASPQRV